jgi:hypothetical protein
MTAAQSRSTAWVEEVLAEPSDKLTVDNLALQRKPRHGPWANLTLAAQESSNLTRLARYGRPSTGSRRHQAGHELKGLPCSMLDAGVPTSRRMFERAKTCGFHIKHPPPKFSVSLPFPSLVRTRHMRAAVLFSCCCWPSAPKED